MLKDLLKRVPCLDGSMMTFTREERASLTVNGRFEVSLLHLKMVEKVLTMLCRLTPELAGEYREDVPLRWFAVRKAPRRFWGNQPLGYHIIRLYFGRGAYWRKVSFRYVRLSEDTFDGRVFNHPLRRNRAR